MDFGLRDAAFVPFFGVPAATLLAPSRMARSLKHGGAAGGGRDAARRPGLPGALPAAWTDWPTDDPEADAPRMNALDRAEIRRNPAQYLWVHKRFKTRPAGRALAVRPRARG
jgi:KDO2-lipid IV(A) lauroyltransferase